MANKYLHRWVLIFGISKSATRKLSKPTQELSDYAWSMQAPAIAMRPSPYSCLPLQGSRCLPSSPAPYTSSADEGDYSANEEAEEKSILRQHHLARSHSCSKLHAALIPSFKSLLHRAISHSHLHNRHSQSCSKLHDFAAERSSAASPSIKQKSKRVPKGHVAVYVEAGRERHVVPIAYLSHPHFQVLLERAESEFGLRQKGPGLRIPCSLSELHHTLHQIRTQ